MISRIHLAFPELPPALDGIGDHTARLAGALAGRAAVTVLTTEETARRAVLDPAVRVRPALRWRGGRVFASGLAGAVADERPDALLLQYNPNSWGRRGLNPFLAGAVRAARRAHPPLRFGLMVHETFYPPTTLRWALLNALQQRQLRALVRTADAVFVSTEAWMAPLRRWNVGVPFVHLPVGSNIEEAGWSREAARAALGIEAGALMAGVFGTARRPDRLLPFVRAAAERLRAEHEARGDGAGFLVLYVGPDGPLVEAALAGLPVRALGALPAAEASRALAAMDLHLAPFLQGVSTRRGSFVAGLQHGLPSVSTRGEHTDRLLAEADGEAFLLAPDADADAYAALAAALAADPSRRRAMAETARKLYREVFDWPLLAADVLAGLDPGGPSRPVRLLAMPKEPPGKARPGADASGFAASPRTRGG